MTAPTSTYITGPSAPYLGAAIGSLRRDRVQGLALGQYATWNEAMQSNEDHYVVQAVGAAMAVTVLDTVTRSEADAYITDDPDGLLA